MLRTHNRYTNLVVKVLGSTSSTSMDQHCDWIRYFTFLCFCFLLSALYISMIRSSRQGLSSTVSVTSLQLMRFQYVEYKFSLTIPACSREGFLSPVHKGGNGGTLKKTPTSNLPKDKELNLPHFSVRPGP